MTFWRSVYINFIVVVYFTWQHKHSCYMLKITTLCRAGSFDWRLNVTPFARDRGLVYMVFDATFNNISVKSWRSVLLVDDLPTCHSDITWNNTHKIYYLLPVFTLLIIWTKYKLRNTTEGTSGAGTAYPSCAPEFTSGFYCTIFSFLSDVL